MIKWTEQKSLNTGFDMFLNDDICYSWYWWLHEVNTLYQPDVKDLMPGILIAWCDGALNADMVEMVMMIILCAILLFIIVMLLLLMDFMSVMMSLMMILPSCDQGGGENQKT